MSRFFLEQGTQAKITEIDLGAVFAALQLKPTLPATVHRLELLRLDQLDAELGGNKWFKLKPHLEHAEAQGVATLGSFGGRHSNHLYALAAAGKRFGFNTIGFVRGYPEQQSTPTLGHLRGFGMRIILLPHGEYRLRHSADYCQHLAQEYDLMLIAEGGRDERVLGAFTELWASLAEPLDVDYLALPAGTGTTLAGLVSSAPAGLFLKGFSALRDQGSIAESVSELLSECELEPGVSWRVDDRWHCGGFGKVSAELAHFLTAFEASTHIELDPIYTAKMLFGVVSDIANSERPQKVLAIHTGGLQGREAMQATLDRANHSAQ